MKFMYEPGGVCCRLMDFDIDKVDGEYIINSVSFVGGCVGNQLGIGSLVKGMKVQDVIKRCKNIKCGNKDTSCPDQLALALEMFLENNMHV